MLVAHPADRLNVMRALAAPVVLFAPFWAGMPEGLGIFVFFLVFLIIGETNYILHLHIHRPFSTRRWLNLLLDLSMGAATAFTASNWRIQHRYGHHCGVDRPFRTAGQTEIAHYSAPRALSYSVRSVLPTFWHPIAVAFRKGVLGNLDRPIDYRWAFIEQMLLVLFVLALLLWQPWLVLFYLLPWYALIAVITRYVDYLNHYGCDERSPNVYERANNCVNRLFNRSCSNFGYHTAHHLYPNAHWTELPAIHARIAERIPERHVKSFSWSCLLFPYHWLLAGRGRM
jgi:fatty acid desaturase